MNSFTNSVNSTVTSAANSAFTAVNSVGTATLDAVNSIGTATLGAVNSIGLGTLTAANSAVSTMNSAVNSLGTTTLQAVNSAANNSLFKNVNNSNRGNNSNKGNSLNSRNNLSPPTASSSGSLSITFGVFLFLIGILVVVFIVFKDQITIAWNNLSVSVRSALGMNPPQNQSPEDQAAIKAAERESPIPTTLDTTYKAKQDQTSVLNAVLPMGTPEVFNVSENEYTFYDAEPLCRALGAELATYDQVQTAWNKGADWCNYGWTKGQVAIYPTQKETWEKLQGGPEDEKGACGRPGINGGYFDNPEMRFGVNCYGIKPDQSSHDQRILMEHGTIPKTVADLKIDKQIEDIKNNIDMIGVLPFSSHKWSTS
jgi:Extracellular link domain